MNLRPLSSELVNKGFRRPPELAESTGGHEESEGLGTRPDYIPKPRPFFASNSA
jgi:hypothetical protein